MISFIKLLFLILCYGPYQIDTFVNPLRSSMRNVSNAVKALPDSLAEGMTKVSDNMGRMSERLGQDIKQSILKVTPTHRGSMLCPINIDAETSSFMFCHCKGVSSVCPYRGLTVHCAPVCHQVPPLLPKTDIDPEHCRVSAQLDDNVSQWAHWVLGVCFISSSSLFGSIHFFPPLFVLLGG